MCVCVCVCVCVATGLFVISFYSYISVYFVFRRVCKIANSYCWLRHVCLLAGTTRLPRDAFLRNFIFQYFYKIYIENQNFIKI